MVHDDFDAHAVTQLILADCDDLFASLQSLGNGDFAAARGASFDLAAFHRQPAVAVGEDEHGVAVRAVGDRRFRHDIDLLGCVLHRLDFYKHARAQSLVRIGELGTHADHAGGGINPGLDCGQTT